MLCNFHFAKLRDTKKKTLLQSRDVLKGTLQKKEETNEKMSLFKKYSKKLLYF